MRTFLLLASLIVLSLLCAANGTGGSGVNVQVLSANCGNKRLILHWRITNNESKPIYLYATFLKGPAAGFDEDDRGVLMLHTSLKDKIHAGVNFYPKAEFTELAPRSSLEGTLQDEQLCSQLTTPKPRDIALDVAFGLEVTEIKKSLQSVANFNEHPANPIVDWRTLILSKPTRLKGAG